MLRESLRMQDSALCWKREPGTSCYGSIHDRCREYCKVRLMQIQALNYLLAFPVSFLGSFVLFLVRLLPLCCSIWKGTLSCECFIYLTGT